MQIHRKDINIINIKKISIFIWLKKNSQNITNKVISNEKQFSNDNNLQLRPIKNIRNCGNNTTTTNNIFNNNIYYIMPIILI